MAQIRLKCLPAWTATSFDDARKIYGKEKSQDRRLISELAYGFNLKTGPVLAILSGEVEATVEGDEIVFEWPTEDVHFKWKERW